MTTIWEAATAAYTAERQARVDAARSLLQQFVGDDVDLPPGSLHQELGVVIHDGEQGILVPDGGGAVRYVVREESGQITAVGGEIRSLADLGRILTELGNSTVQQKPR